MQLEKKDIEKLLRKVFLGVIGCIVVYWLLHDTERVKSIYNLIMNILSPFIVGAVLAFILNVPMRAYEKMLKKIKNFSLRRTVAASLAFVTVILLLVGVCLLLIPQLIETIQTLIPTLETFFTKTWAWVKELLKDNPDLLNKLNESVKNLNWASLAENGLKVVGDSVTVILDSTFTAIAAVAGGLMNLFISVVFAVYGLVQKETLARQGRKLMYAFFPEKIADETVRVLRLSNATFSNFLSGQCLEVVILGAMFAVSMAIFGMPYIPLISVLVAITAFIPVVGAWVGCIFGAFFILVTDPMQAVWFVILFLVLQQIENHMIYPRVVGTSIGLPGMWVLFAVSLGGAVMGVAGMFLMIPLVSVVYTLLGEITNKRLAKRQIQADKLMAHPPELKSKFKEKRERKKAQKANKKASKNEKK